MIDENVFEIHDFSTSSDWERFIADLEEIFIQWELGSSSGSSQLQIEDGKKSELPVYAGRLERKEEQIRFGRYDFVIMHCFVKHDPGDTSEDSTRNESVSCRGWYEMNSVSSDWQMNDHPLMRYYGLTQFLELYSKDVELNNEDRIRHLLGSAAIALNQTGTEIPFFCRISKFDRHMFMGLLHVENSFRTYFEMIQFPEVPSSFRHMSDLIDLFKSKLYYSFAYNSIKSELSERIQSSIQISIRFTYTLTNWPPQYNLFSGNLQQISFFDRFTYFASNYLPSDHFLEPVQLVFWQKSPDLFERFTLFTIWPSVAEELIVDNAYHSDLNPHFAPKWSLSSSFKLRPSENLLLVSNLLSKFVELKQRYKATRSLTSEDISNESVDARAAFDRLTDTSPFGNVSQLLNPIKQALNTPNGKEEFFCKIIDDIFTDATFDDPCKSLLAPLGVQALKSAPYGSLSWRISLLISNVLLQSSGTRLIGQIWSTFVRQLRNHWLRGKLLPHLQPPDDNFICIDFGHCLFDQKLRMLNCCIKQKIKREHAGDEEEPEGEREVEEESTEEEEEEFYDCDDEKIPDPEGRTVALTDTAGKTIYQIKNRSEPIYIPITQDTLPMTEDMLVAQMENLATHFDDLKTKIEHQSAGLLSDMEAFKAANPGCQFEDFIRWHSPRDWIEQETDDMASSPGKFGLSKRMQESTVWRDIWNVAKACPIKRQKRLFNYTKEAEQILSQFESITVHQLVDYLSPVVAMAVIRRVALLRNEILLFINESCTKNIPPEQFHRLIPFNTDHVTDCFKRTDYTALFGHLSLVESHIINFFSMMKKLIVAFENETKQSFDSITKDGQKVKNPKEIKTISRVDSLQLEDFIQLTIELLSKVEMNISNTNPLSQLIIRLMVDSKRFDYEQTTSVGDRLPEDIDEDRSRPSKSQLPPPSRKEFIFRAVSIPRPAPYSRASPQRMYCSITPRKDFRVACAFTEDTAFC